MKHFVSDSGRLLTHSLTHYIYKKSMGKSCRVSETETICAKAFYRSAAMPGPCGVKMKITMAVVALLMACLTAGLLVSGGFAQDTSRYQSVGEDYGKSLFGTLRTTNPEPAASNNSSLWSWGGSPKGTSILNGGLAGDPKYSMKKLNVTYNWLGDSFLDPYGNTPAYSFTDPDTGAPVKTFVDPYTGQYYYIYTDSRSGKPVYVYFDPETGVPFYATFSPPAGAEMNTGANVGTNAGNAGANAGTNGITLPPVYGSGDPWSQDL